MRRFENRTGLPNETKVPKEPKALLLRTYPLRTPTPRTRRRWRHRLPRLLNNLQHVLLLIYKLFVIFIVMKLPQELYQPLPVPPQDILDLWRLLRVGDKNFEDVEGFELDILAPVAEEVSSSSSDCLRC